jgi:hypothetical protein
VGGANANGIPRARTKKETPEENSRCEAPFAGAAAAAAIVREDFCPAARLGILKRLLLVNSLGR